MIQPGAFNVYYNGCLLGQVAGPIHSKGATMSEKKLTKSAAIREYVTAHPDASNEEVIAHLSAVHGLQATTADVSSAKWRMKVGSTPKVKKTRKPRKAKTADLNGYLPTGSPAAPFLAVAHKARQLANEIRELGGVEAFQKICLEIGTDPNPIPF